MNAGRPLYNSVQWRRVRSEVLQRDSWRCQVRGPKCTGKATQVDHIVPWSIGGSWFDPTNLRASCAACNAGRAHRVPPVAASPSREW